MSRTSVYKPSFFYNNILFYDKSMIHAVISEKSSQYYSMVIPKKRGLRQLSCLVEGELKSLQNNLRKNFLNHIPIPNYVYGFVKGGSYRKYLEPHSGNKTFLRIDIKDFFSSIRFDDLKQCFSYYFRIDEPEKSLLLNDLIEIVTFNQKVPQGAITSPVISNIVFRQLDIRIFNYCRKHNVNYSRYADDMLFSSEQDYLLKPHFTKMISHILSSKGFQINRKKLRKSLGPISINGYVLDDNIRFSRSKLKDINKVIYIFNSQQKPIDTTRFLNSLNNEEFLYRKKKDDLFFPNINSLVHYLAGYRSFLIDWSRKELNVGSQSILATISKIESIIRCLI